jgi:hypothetical protein
MYGFVADLNKTQQQNAVLALSEQPPWYYFSKPSNNACHNLCTTKVPPHNYRALLSLGLNFCPRPRYTTHDMTDSCERFKRDINTQMFMAHMQQKDVPALFLRSKWEPPPWSIPPSLSRRSSNFTAAITRDFIKKKTRSNLLPFQRRLLSELRNSQEFIIVQADKNLGPCILEREVYIQRALNDHLLDKNTYKQLEKEEASREMDTVRYRMTQFMTNNKKYLSKPDFKFLQRSLVVDDPFPKFYLTAKIHKTPWKTRPIVSVSGSLLHGLGKWVDKQLQPFARDTNAHVKSSFEIKTLLVNLPPLPSTARLFTADAVSMYTNIDTRHGLQQVSEYLRLSKIDSGTNKGTINMALALIMNNNILQFGNTYWKQVDGTAMGTPPAPTYATIYCALHEDEAVRKFGELRLFKRYIDDIIGIWVPNPDENDDDRWASYQAYMDTHKKIRWEFTERSHQAIFLDLLITIGNDHKISTKIYEKPLNLYLYLPPHSTHPSGVLKGLVYGSITRIYRLTSDRNVCKDNLNDLFLRLKARGHKSDQLLPLFKDALLRLRTRQLQAETQADATLEEKEETEEKRVFFHLQYHPMDPPSNHIQQLFRDELLLPRGSHVPLSGIPNHKNARIGTNRLIVCYHRPPNLGNLMSPRVLTAEHGPPVSAYL